jgi:hypothetical protein
MNSLEDVYTAIVNDFPTFCKYCITLPARNWRVPPDKSIIRDIPFVLADHQLEFLEYLNSSVEDKVVLKCRQKGFSVMILAYCLWRVLYGRNERILYMIDSLTKCKSFRQQIKYMYKNIPEVFRPTGVNILATNLIENLARNNTVHIVTARGNAVRSGTFSMIVLDEFAFYEERVQNEIVAGINASCPDNRVWVSTPAKEDDIYHNKVRAARAAGTLYKHNYFDHAESWFGSMENAKLWRANAEIGLTEAQINRELDCKFKGAAEDLIWFTGPPMFRSYIPNPKALNIVSLDLGWADDTAVLWARDYGQMLHIHDELITNQTTIPSVVGLIKGRAHRLKYGICDSSGKKVDQTSGISSHRQLQQRLGCRFLTRKTGKIEMLRIANSALLEGRVFIDAESCPNLTQMLNNYEWANGNKMPHNRYSHIHDALVYMIYNWQKRERNRVDVRMVNKSSIRSII